MTSLTKCAWLRLNGLTCGIWIISSELYEQDWVEGDGDGRDALELQYFFQ